MDSYDTADGDEHPMLGRLIKLGLFLLVQGIAVMLVAFVALLVSLSPDGRRRRSRPACSSPAMPNPAPFS